MSSLQTRVFPARALLAAAVVWLVWVSLCSTRTLAEQPADAHPHTAACAAHHARDASPQGDKHDDGCGCESFKAFPANTTELAKAPAPAISLPLYTVLLDGLAYESAARAITAQNTGPPGRISPGELVLQRCHLSHAPPLVV